MKNKWWVFFGDKYNEEESEEDVLAFLRGLVASPDYSTNVLDFTVVYGQLYSVDLQLEKSN